MGTRTRCMLVRGAVGFLAGVMCAIVLMLMFCVEHITTTTMLFGFLSSPTAWLGTVLGGVIVGGAAVTSTPPSPSSG